MRQGENRVRGQKIIARRSEVEQIKGSKGYWQLVSEDGLRGGLTEKGEATIKKALGCKEIRVIHPETGFELCGLNLGIVTVPPGSNTLLHRHNCWEILYILNGTAKNVIDGKEFLAEKNDAVNVPPNVAHNVVNESSEPIEYIWITSPPLNALMDDVPTALKYAYIPVVEEEIDKS